MKGRQLLSSEVARRRISTDDVMTSHVIMRVLVRPITGRRPNPRYVQHLVLATKISVIIQALPAVGAGKIKVVEVN